MGLVRFGLSNCHYSKRTVTNNVVSYAAPVAMGGAVSIVMDEEVAKSVFYADNQKYNQIIKRTGFSGTLEIAIVPDAFKKEFLGYKLDNANHLTATNEIGGEFALLWQEEQSDGTNKKYAIFNCKASSLALGSETAKDTTDAKTSQVTIDCAGEEVDDLVVFNSEVANFTSLAVPSYTSV